MLIDKDLPIEDIEAPIDPENVNNPTEPIRIEERIKKKKRRKRTTKTRPPGTLLAPEGHCAAGSSPVPQLEVARPSPRSQSMASYVPPTVPAKTGPTIPKPPKDPAELNTKLPWKSRKGTSKVITDGSSKVAPQVVSKERRHAIEARAKAAPVPVRDMATRRCSTYKKTKTKASPSCSTRATNQFS